MIREKVMNNDFTFKAVIFTLHFQIETQNRIKEFKKRSRIKILRHYTTTSEFLKKQQKNNTRLK